MLLLLHLASDLNSLGCPLLSLNWAIKERKETTFLRLSKEFISKPPRSGWGWKGCRWGCRSDYDKTGDKRRCMYFSFTKDFFLNCNLNDFMLTHLSVMGKVSAIQTETFQRDPKIYSTKTALNKWWRLTDIWGNFFSVTKAII